MLGIWVENLNYVYEYCETFDLMQRKYLTFYYTKKI